MTAEVGAADARAAPDLSLNKVVALMAAQTLVMVALGLALWHFSGREFAQFLVPSPSGALQGIVFGVGLILVAWFVFTRFPALADRLVRLQTDTYRFLGPHLPTWAIVAISLGAGIGEEALFRAGLQVWLGDRIGVPAAIAVASSVFAAFHLGKPLITAVLFVIGAVFGGVYWLTDSLLTVMIGHVLYDIWALRWLHREFLRMGVFDEPEPVAAPLANPADPG